MNDPLFAATIKAMIFRQMERTPVWVAVHGIIYTGIPVDPVTWHEANLAVVRRRVEASGDADQLQALALQDDLIGRMSMPDDMDVDLIYMISASAIQAGLRAQLDITVVDMAAVTAWGIGAFSFQPLYHL